MKCLPLFAVALAFTTCHANIYNNEIVRETPRIKSGDELLSAIVDDCFTADSATECLKSKVLTYLDTVLGLGSESSRAFSPENLDNVIYNRIGRILNKNEFRLTLPEYFFQSAEMSYRADRGLDVDFPKTSDEDDESGSGEARGILKKKLLLPVLLLLKLKMKLLMPIFVALIGIKALKALILSKLAIVLVVGFLVSQLLKKGGMPMAMSMAPVPEPIPPPTAYGPAASASPSAATPADSYSPQWEPSSSGPYARVWDTTAAQASAYSAYYPGSSSSSSSSYNSPSSSSSSSPSVSSGTSTN